MSIKKDIRITVHSEQTILQNELFENAQPQHEVLESSNLGTLTYDRGKYTLVYNESDASGMKGSVTTLRFDENKRGELTMSRTGTSKLSLIFSEGMRYNTTYDTGVIPINMTMNTYLLKNDITEDGGKLSIVYFIEMHGMCKEETKLKITVMV